MYIKDAIRDYSMWFPRRIDRFELVEANGHYALPSDFVREIDVESPEDTYWIKKVERPGVRFTTGKFYFIDGGNLYLGEDTDDEVELSYLAVHDVPTSETDLTFELSIPDRDIELIRIYVRAQVHIQMRSKQARLDRFEAGSGRRDDNPLLPETTNLMDEYYKKIAERVTGGPVVLYRSRP
jgi:hypothetical protein